MEMLAENLFMYAPDTPGQGYAPNWMNKYKIGEPTESNQTEPEELHELAAGIQEATPSQEDSSETYEYYADRGGSTTDVTGVTSTFAFTGHRKYATDDAQEFVRGRLNKAGQGRLVFFKHTEPDGKVIMGNATLSGIVHTGGSANARGNFECSVTFNGVPYETTVEAGNGDGGSGND